MKNVKTKIPMWFWVVAVFFLLWNLMGVSSFFTHTFISNEVLDALPIAEKELYESYPLWTKIVFAIGIFGGLLGSIGLVLKKKWSKLSFIISLCAIIPQMIYNVFVSKSMEVHGTVSIVIPIMVVAFGIFIVWFSEFGIRKSWLK